MKRILAAFRTVLAATALALVAPLVLAAAYEAPLPAEINTGPDLCAMVACHEVMPGADSFSERMGRPAYVEAYRDAEQGRE
ncbi:MAG: hypothetical protein LC646_11230, partial [Xanthomonadaceae bacterium]|nr:hypothetical protein [Xanthomonadaceae bacterium]